MELDNKCPFCGGWLCDRLPSTGEIWGETGAFYFNCKDRYQCTIHPSVWYGEEKDVIRRFHQIYLFLKRTPYIRINGLDRKYYFYYEEETIGKQPDHPQKKNVAELMKNYPKTFMEKMSMALFSIYKEYGEYGQVFNPQEEMTHMLYCNNFDFNVEDGEIPGVLNILSELGYLHKINVGWYRITAKGWERISDIESVETNNQGFIAMAFRDETRGISDAFKNAIRKCGYIPKRIDEKEHNKQIVPEILFEISRSKFVVVDITYPNYGAYYEAGYAEALGKEVIICCRDKEFQPHFDIAQKSAIIWKDEKDLEEKLHRRIEATVGIN